MHESIRNILLFHSDFPETNATSYRLGEDWNHLCTHEALQATDKLIARPNNDIPPLLSNAQFVPAETSNPSEDTPNASPTGECAPGEMISSLSSEAPLSSDTSNSEQATLTPASASSLQMPECSESESSQCELQSKIRDETQTASEFLPERTYYYNSKNSYIFPGAELWWKDSDNESVSSDSSSGDDDDVEDEIDNIRNELEQSYAAQENSQLNSTYDMFFANEHAQKDIDSSSCSSNLYDSTAESGIIQKIDYTFTSSTVTATAAAEEVACTSHSHTITSGSSRKRSSSPTVDDVTSTCTFETTGVDNVQKRMKLTETLLVSNSGEISEN